MAKVLVTGGAGYIGSHACKALARAGFTPVAFDNLSTGWAEAVKYGPLVVGDLMDRAAVAAAIAEHQPVAVMHFAALSLVGESMKDPGLYWRVNVGGALNLIGAAAEAGIRYFVFSSTCATYGDQDGVMLTEDTPQYPINAYGGSKRAIEDILRDFGAACGLEHVIFRYFNVAGADPEGELGEQHRPETHLIPLMLDAVAGRRPALTVFGDDYPTPDGTCVRDYVHVSDLVAAHVLGLRWLMDGKGSRVFNLGSGRGFSVREVIGESRAVTNREVPVVQGARRPGDAAALVSASTRAIEELGWQPRHSALREMIAHAWAWAQKPEYRR
ncbi:UDP-glucose 4-epimerase GalE [Pseudogemmobacter humi]|nr:UDP-glucose 4-epimerase GalE [Pseudogemmobacter humi]